VLIFLEGLNGFRQMNTSQVEELVSHGYVVAAVDQPYAAASVRFPDGRRVTGLTKAQMEPFTAQSLAPVADAPVLYGRTLPQGSIPYLAEDVSFTLDRLAALDRHDPDALLTGRLDLRRTGTFGMSLGAIVAAEACRTDPRLAACLMIDAAMPADVVHDGLRQPSMWITHDAATMRLERSQAGGWSEYDITQTLTSMRAVFVAGPPGQGYYVQVPGMFQVNFTDTPLHSPVARQMGFAGPIDARRGQGIVDAYSLAFFDRYLADRPSDLLAGPSPRFPDALVEVRGR
jgi:predicted dienelactone hydrolase